MAEEADNGQVSIPMSNLEADQNNQEKRAFIDVDKEKDQEEESDNEPESVSAVLLGFAKKTSLQGMTFIIGYKRWFHRFAWLFLLCFAIIATLIQLYFVFKKYYSYDIATKINIGFNNVLSFPSVTVCNISPIRASKVHLASLPFQEFLKAMEPDKTYDGAIFHQQQSYNNISSQEGMPANFSLDSNGTADPYSPVHGSLDFDFGAVGGFEDSEYFDEAHGEGEQSVEERIQESFKHFLGEESVAVQKKMGYQVNSLIPSCSFDGKVCGPVNFTYSQSIVYGNCFTFNNAEHLKSERSGAQHGLNLILYLEDHENVKGISSGLGARMAVHPFRTMPFLDSEGTSFPVGFKTYVGLKLVNISRLGKPYGHCEIGEEFSKRYNNDIYTMEACHRACVDTLVAKKCKCYVPENARFYTKEEIQTLPHCGDSNWLCWSTVYLAVRENSEECNCSPACSETVYQTVITQSVWPDVGYWYALVTSVCKRIGPTHRTCQYLTRAPEKDREKILRGNFLSLKIYYEDLSYESIEQVPDYERAEFLSDVGGTAGLWFGFSLLSVFELVDLIASLIVYGAKKKKVPTAALR